MYKVLVVALKKLKTFIKFWKITGQISRVFKEFKTLYEPYM